jgi:membrane protease YdiL (CAAX protease family)
MILIFSGIIGNLILPFIFKYLGLSLPVSIIVSQTALLLFPTIIYFMITKLPIRDTLRLYWPGTLTILIAIMIAVFVQPAMMFLSSLSTLFFDNDIAKVVQLMDALPLLVTVGVVALTPAICEEITMRGILLSGYKNIDIKKAALLNGLFFGMLHLNLQQFLYAFALGVLFAYIVHITNSIIPTMVAHFTINGSQVLLQRLGTWAAEYQGQTISQMADPTFKEKLLLVGFTFILALVFIPIVGLLLYALKNIHSKPLIESNTIQKEKVMSWPVYASIGVFVVFMGTVELLKIAIRSLSAFN